MKNKLAWFIIAILITTTIWAGFKLFENDQSEIEWMKINSEYTRISYEAQNCIYICNVFQEELKPCFDICDDELNSNLEKIGIRHDAWRKKYVD